MRELQVSHGRRILHCCLIRITNMIFSPCFRARRVKCDEQKPACSKCTASNRKCEGYADPFRSPIQMVPAPRAPSNLSSGLSATSARPTNDLQLSLRSGLSLPLDADERRYFHHFRKSCVPDLVGLVDAELWNRYILQNCASKPAVQHALLALSAQHETFLISSLSSDEECSPENERSATFSRRQYSKAIKRLHRQLDQASKPEENVEETLVICLLFIVFGVLQGNYREALIHLEGGLGILTNCYQSAISAAEHVSENVSNSSLAKAFQRLDIQAASYVMSRNVKLFPSALSQCSQPSIPALAGRSELTFTNIREACDTLNMRIASVYHFMRSPAPSLRDHFSLRSKWVMDLKYEPLVHSDAVTFSSVLQEQKLHLNALRNWALAFEAFLKQSEVYTNHTEPKEFGIQTEQQAKRYAALWISYLIIFTTLATLLEPDERAYDAFLPHFEKIVDHAEFVLFPHVRGDRVPAERKKFSMEMNVIQPLYFTALKCRNHTLRHHAAALLQVCGQEGVWDGSMLAAIAKYIIEIEESERYMEAPPDSIPITELALEQDEQKLEIPERARVHGVGLDVLDSVKGKICIEFSKRNFISTKGVRNKMESFGPYEWVFHKKLLEGWKASLSQSG